MQHRHALLNILSSAKPMLVEKYDIKDMALFGSYSRDEALPGSDVDVLVDFKKPIGIRFIDLADELESLLHLKVDLVSRKGIKPKYFQSIQAELLYV